MRTTVLQAGQQVIAEGNNVDRLAAGGAIKDSNVLMVAIQLEDRNAAVEQLLIAEVVALDVDLTISASGLAQVTTSRLRHDQILGATLGVHSIQGLVKLAGVKGTAAVVDVLAGARRQASGQTVEFSRVAVGVTVDEQTLEGQTHCASLGLDLVGTGFGTFEVHDGAVNLDVTTEQLQRFALLLDGGIALGIAIVEGTEAHVAEGLLTLPEQTVALHLAEGQALQQGTSGEFGNDRQFLGIG